MDDFRTLRQLVVGWLLLLVALIPMNAQNGNVLGQVIRLPKSKGNIYQLLGLVTERSGYLFIYDSKIIDNEQTTSIKGGDYTIQEAIYAITGNKKSGDPCDREPSPTLYARESLRSQKVYP